MSDLSLHLDTDRRATFKRRSGEPIRFNKEMRCWIVLDPNHVVRLLRHPALACEEFGQAIATVGERYGDDFANLKFAIGAIPLMNEGEAHIHMRRRMAEFLAARRPYMAKSLPTLVTRHLGKIADAGEIDLFSDVLVPFVRDIGTVLAGSTRDIPFDPVAITRVFDRYLSLATLRMVESELAALRAALAKGCPTAVAGGDEDLLVSILVLGRDSLLATLSESVAANLAAGIGRRLDEIEFADFPNETGVAIAERIATGTFSFGGADIAIGDRVRLYLQSLNYSDRITIQRLIFGAGSHSCLGRQLSLDMWPAVTKALGSMGGIVESVEHGYLKNHIFVMPEHIRVRFSV
jgi:cytochrome P450